MAGPTHSDAEKCFAYDLQQLFLRMGRIKTSFRESYCSRIYMAVLDVEFCRRKAISTGVLEDEEEEVLLPRNTRRSLSEDK